jgi:hypothetical protein
MFVKTFAVIITTAVAVHAASTIDIQLGVTQFYGWHHFNVTNELGYKADLAYEYDFDTWALNANIRGLAFPGRYNTFAWYADVTAPFYFTDAPVRVYAAPGLGYAHTEKRIVWYGVPPERSKHDFFRFPLAFGVKAISGSKYLDIRFQLTPEIPLGETTSLFSEVVLDFYLEQIIEAEFGWAFSKNVGISSRAGVIRGNHAVKSNIYEEHEYNYYSPYVPFVEVGPSIYF